MHIFNHRIFAKKSNALQRIVIRRDRDNIPLCIDNKRICQDIHVTRTVIIHDNVHHIFADIFENSLFANHFCKVHRIPVIIAIYREIYILSIDIIQRNADICGSDKFIRHVLLEHAVESIRNKSLGFMQCFYFFIACVCGAEHFSDFFIYMMSVFRTA